MSPYLAKERRSIAEAERLKAIADARYCICLLSNRMREYRDEDRGLWFEMFARRAAHCRTLMRNKLRVETAMPSPAGSAGISTGAQPARSGQLQRVGRQPQGPNPYRHGLLVLSLALLCQVPVALVVLFIAGILEF